MLGLASGVFASAFAPPHHPYILVIVAFLAALVGGIAGFAFAAIAVALMLPFGDAVTVVPVIVIGSVLIQAIALFSLRGHLEWGKLWPFLMGGFLGVPIGFAGVQIIEPKVFRLLIGSFLILFSVYGLARRSPQRITGGGRIADAAAGLLGGVMGGFAGMSGILPTMWCSVRPWPPNVQRSVFQPYILIMQIAVFLYGGSTGVFPAASLALAAICAPAFLAGTLAGVWIYSRLRDFHFRTIVLILLLVSGITLFLPTG